MVAKRHLDDLRSALRAGHGEVEVFRFEGKHATLAEVFDELRGYSLMMTYKLVVVSDADQWVKQHREPWSATPKTPWTMRRSSSGPPRGTRVRSTS